MSKKWKMPEWIELKMRIARYLDEGGDNETTRDLLIDCCKELEGQVSCVLDTWYDIALDATVSLHYSEPHPNVNFEDCGHIICSRFNELNKQKHANPSSDISIDGAQKWLDEHDAEIRAEDNKLIALALRFSNAFACYVVDLAKMDNSETLKPTLIAHDEFREAYAAVRMPPSEGEEQQ